MCFVWVKLSSFFSTLLLTKAKRSIIQTIDFLTLHAEHNSDQLVKCEIKTGENRSITYNV